MASLTHYVVLAQDRVEATVFARSNAFQAAELREGSGSIDIPELGIAIPLVDLYRDVPIG